MHELNEFIGKTVVIIYREFDKERTIVGKLLNSGEDFLTIESRHRTYAISKNSVIKVKEWVGDRNV